MENKKNYDFLKISNIFATLSIVVTVVFLAVILMKGFNYGIDFAGGTEFQVKFTDSITSENLRSFADELGLDGSVVQSLGVENKEFLLRVESIGGKSDKETNVLLTNMVTKIKAGLFSTFAAQVPEIRSIDSVGPQVGEELKKDGLLAVFYSLIMILVYVAFRFDYKYAPGAVFCLFHDAIFTLGIFVIFEREVNVQTLAAVLTIIGYSLNDTIVTFDRIRENVEVYKGKAFSFIVNQSLNDVLSRTLLTSITTFLSVVAMYYFADGVIRDFAFTLGIGVVIGTYSSIFVASPLVLLVDKLQNKSA